MAEAFAATSTLPFTDDQARARVRMVSGADGRTFSAGEGVGEGRRPASVQIDDGGRRGPFSGLYSFERFAAAPACVGARPVVGGRRGAVARSPCAHCFANPWSCPFRRDRAGMAALQYAYASLLPFREAVGAPQPRHIPR